jgi:hypothetical protein
MQKISAKVKGVCDPPRMTIFGYARVSTDALRVVATAGNIDRAPVDE